MTLDADRPDEQEPDDRERGEREGRLRPTSAGVLTAWAAIGIVGGWLLHPVGRELWGTPPLVGWVQVLALATLAGAVGVTAWTTWRTLHVRRERMEPRLAMNRFVLGRSTALVGALAAGGYLGYAISWLGVGSQRADERLWRSLAATGAALLVMCAALLLERACRVRSDDVDA